jgi:hypothetical protein
LLQAVVIFASVSFNPLNAAALLELRLDARLEGIDIRTGHKADLDFCPGGTLGAGISLSKGGIEL